MIVSLIVAMDEEGGIGKKGELPWRLSADLKHFKKLTWGHHLVMGRKTFESIGRALPGRTSIIITRNTQFTARGCLIAYSLDAALALADKHGDQEAFVVGGVQIFAQALPKANRLYLTRVHARRGCDVYFPPLKLEDWRLVEQIEHPADESNEYDFTFLFLEKIEDSKTENQGVF